MMNRCSHRESTARAMVSLQNILQKNVPIDVRVLVGIQYPEGYSGWLTEDYLARLRESWFAPCGA